VKRTLAVLTAVLVVGLFAGSAFAITDGEPDNGRHPYVGLMLAQDAAGAPLFRCSGTLMSATVYLTAGHCTEAPAAHIEIWFEEGPIATDPAYLAAIAAGNTRAQACAIVRTDGVDTGSGYPCEGDVGGTPYTHPQYDPNAFFLYDLGVVVLDEPYASSTYGALPQLRQLDELKTQRGKQDVTFTAVGYGLQQSFPDAASFKDVAIRQRLVSYPRLIQINNGYVRDFSILLSNNAHTGGTCFGDSGGPNFIGDSNVVGGVTSFGKNGNCAGTGGVYRVDQPDDLAWLATFGLTPA